ncbi:SbcC/MukB-like Walker B domain-containing protein [Kineosporia sp. A_224]|uniref:SbcC/MukB-like Walker B domain-containing protein n=1 Tax=Kineosporia sp. A_224 TaxID=1962180 RepID=UPI000B4A9CE2|nr:SbcC/MukB-like Walker B domain-containing protein [Kineosporia sp. A_224]
MTLDLPTPLFADDDLQPPSGHPERFGGRWRLIGAGLSNVWRYGDLVLDAGSGRLLLRGPNGTGKTTALEALWPYLLDLNARQLVAGKARTTSLASLMREGATGKRRYGYVWMTLEGPGSEGRRSFGVRLQYSDGATPTVKVLPFTIPGTPLTDLALHGADRAPLTLEQFTETVERVGGQLFDDEDEYLTHLAAQVWQTTPTQLRDLAQRIRAVRNPSLLGDVSPRAAAEALREALPTVAEDVVTATAEALAESDATRQAFARDSQAADVLDAFAATWAGHVVAVVADLHRLAVEAEAAVTSAVRARRAIERDHEKALATLETAHAVDVEVTDRLRDLDARIQTLEHSDAYRAAGALSALEQQLTAEQRLADDTSARLLTSAAEVRRRTGDLRDALTDIDHDLDEVLLTATSADPAAALPEPILRWSTRPRATVTVGQATADPGPAVDLDNGTTRLDDAAAGWTALARAHTQRAADAQLALADHRSAVAGAQRAADAAQQTAGRAERESDVARQEAERATAQAVRAADALLDAVGAWGDDDRIGDDRTSDDDSRAAGSGDADAEEPDDRLAQGLVDDLRGAEPSQVVNEVRSWRAAAAGRAARICARLTEERRQRLATAQALRTEAVSLRTEAAELRAGRPLPLPRPHWLDDHDDSRSLAVALEWAPTCSDPRERALVETALAASGLLAATLSSSGAETTSWRVGPFGLPMTASLAGVLTVDPTHPLADVAADVLRRIAVRESAEPRPGLAPDDASAGPGGTGSEDEGVTIVIGRDGTFRAGPLVGHAPGADDATALPPAQHIGAAQRLAAALARADQLDHDAEVLEGQAVAAIEDADRLARRADNVDRRAGAFPTTDDLERYEARRAAAATRAHELSRAAHDAVTAAQEAAEAAAGARREWAERTCGRDLPADVDELDTIRADSGRTADTLHRAAAAITGSLRRRVERLHSDAASVDAAATDLTTLRMAALDAHDEAAGTAEKVRTLQALSGDDARTAVEEHHRAVEERDLASRRVRPAREDVVRWTSEVSTLAERLLTAQGTERDARPVADGRRSALAALLTVPGVSEVILGGATTAADGTLDEVGAALAGRRSAGRKSLRERYDTARAALAGTWALDPGDSQGELDTFVLTHDDVTYTPPTATRRAAELKERAQAALAAAEESALRDFVIGRLPSAIGTAWTRLHDWVTDVNRKMRAAEASSGVGVRVRARLADDLPPAARTVYELACTVADADRSREQKAQIGQAIQQLIAAADGPSMTERLAAAVDVREWVDVHYEVIRPGGTAQRWSARTGLSGGERRLVVLAPMLAAVAAAYDSLAGTGLRLTALDEVPAEVDERGREGLARYLADLDLDLVCTSYLWDGAPGAWDGVDAHDLEAGPDGTVVAFPMLIRGLIDLPGDHFAATGPST